MDSSGVFCQKLMILNLYMGSDGSAQDMCALDQSWGMAPLSWQMCETTILLWDLTSFQSMLSVGRLCEKHFCVILWWEL